MDTSESKAGRPKWARWAMRAVLLGFGLAAAAVALVAWFGEPPITAPLFYAGIGVAGLGVVVGTIGVMLTHSWKGER
jgi:hypothetical protein